VKILIAHNSYTKPGGEDVVFESESALLEQHGHDVVRYLANNREAGEYNRVVLAANSIWNTKVVRQVRALIQRTHPDVVHVHNTLPLISPAIYHAAHAEGVPVVQTLHNFRLICPKADLLRDGKLCEECIGSWTYWPGVVHGCYRGSRMATAVVAAMIASHTLLRTWDSRIDRYIAMSEFMRRKYIEGGWAADKITVKPNFFDYPAHARHGRGEYVLFAGRLSEEKGIKTLLGALARMSKPPRVKIAGEGPLMPADLGSYPNVEWLGFLPRGRVIELMQRASVLVFPSEWYEGCPLTIIEAFATGLPVIASRLGNMAEMVTDGVTGLLFGPTDSADLAAVIEWALSHPDETAGMGAHARTEFEQKYTPQRNYEALMAIYHAVLNREGQDGESNGNGADAGNRDRPGPDRLRAGTTSR
jgi:glycosyltransferase involved in cell wall biosynthesis